MREQEKLRMYADIVKYYMEIEIYKLQNQVEVGEISREWLKGYIRGAKEYEKLLLQNEITFS